MTSYNKYYGNISAVRGLTWPFFVVLGRLDAPTSALERHHARRCQQHRSEGCGRPRDGVRKCVLLQPPGDGGVGVGEVEVEKLDSCGCRGRRRRATR